MGLSDLFKKKDKAKKEPEQTKPEVDEEANTDGWTAIEKEFLRVYPGQTNPQHYGTLVKWSLGGNDPLDGISIYDGGSYWHFVTFGLSEIYGKETDNKDISGYGYEMTLKLKKYKFKDEERELKNICGILQAIARITYTKGEVFLPDEFIRTGQQTGMDADQKSNITGFITVSDPSVNTIDTPNGKVEFVELIGVTDAELKTLSSIGTVRDIYAELGSDITDYHRQSIR